MIQHIWTLACRIGITGRESNNVSLIEVLEEIVLPPMEARPGETPGMVPAFFEIVTLWAREDENQPERATGRLSLISPQGETVFGQEYEIDLSQFQRIRNTTRLFGFPMVGAGKYYFRSERRTNVDAPWEEVGGTPLWIRTAPQDAAPAGQDGRPIG